MQEGSQPYTSTLDLQAKDKLSDVREKLSKSYNNDCMSSGVLQAFKAASDRVSITLHGT